MAYFLLTGKVVFEGDSFIEVCSQHLFEEPVPPSQRETGIPEGLEQIIMQCLEKDPSRRQQSAASLGDVLHTESERVGVWSARQAKAWWETNDTMSSGAAPALVPEAERTLRVDVSGRV